MLRRTRAVVCAAATLGFAGAALAQGAPAIPAVAATHNSAAVDPQMQKVLDAHKSLKPKPLHTLNPAQARKGPTAKDAVMKVLKDEKKPNAPEKVAKVDDRQIDGAKGKIPARLYTPQGTGPFPAVVYFHGGGFVVANKDVYDAGPRALANQANAVVVSVDYRQAPENRYPAALDDATAAFLYVAKNAKQLNIDPARIAVAGESAGGNLATGVAMRQKGSNGPTPVFQLLIYPFVSTDLKKASHQQNGNGDYLVSNEDLGWFWQQYLGEGWVTNSDPMAVPLKASTADLKGVAPALILTASLDPLLDEGKAYAEKLKTAGVRVDYKNYDGVTHEFFGMAPVLDKAKQAQNDAGAALKAVFKQGTGTATATGGSGLEPPKL